MSGAGIVDGFAASTNGFAGLSGYSVQLKFAAARVVMERFFPEVMAQWRASGVRNGHGPLCDWQFNVIDDLIEYGGMLYGDWSTFLADDQASR